MAQSPSGQKFEFNCGSLKKNIHKKKISSESLKVTTYLLAYMKKCLFGAVIYMYIEK